jgi:hypothetical protein
MVKAFIAFMDHSISEQLTGAPGSWHTTAIVMSESGECDALAAAIARDISRGTTRLRKWSRAKDGPYRERFAEALSKHLPSSGVTVLGSSATERLIRANEGLIRADFRLTSATYTYSGVGQVKIGPFVHRVTGAQHYFQLPEKHAVMVLWVAHLISRLHQGYATILRQSGVDLFSLDWLPLYLDRFPGNYQQSTALFQALVSAQVMRDGNVRAAYFTAREAHSSVLADNIAGLFNGWRQENTRGTVEVAILNSGRMYYEAGT